MAISNQVTLSAGTNSNIQLTISYNKDLDQTTETLVQDGNNIGSKVKKGDDVIGAMQAAMTATTEASAKSPGSTDADGTKLGLLQAFVKWTGLAPSQVQQQPPGASPQVLVADVQKGTPTDPNSTKIVTNDAGADSSQVNVNKGTNGNQNQTVSAAPQKQPAPASAPASTAYTPPPIKEDPATKRRSDVIYEKALSKISPPMGPIRAGGDHRVTSSAGIPAKDFQWHDYGFVPGTDNTVIKVGDKYVSAFDNRAGFLATMKSMNTWDKANSPNSWNLSDDQKKEWGKMDGARAKDGKETSKITGADDGSFSLNRSKSPPRDIEFAYTTPEMEDAGVVAYETKDGYRRVVMKDISPDAYAAVLASAKNAQHN